VLSCHVIVVVSCCDDVVVVVLCCDDMVVVMLVRSGGTKHSPWCRNTKNHDEQQ